MKNKYYCIKNDKTKKKQLECFSCMGFECKGEIKMRYPCFWNGIPDKRDPTPFCNKHWKGHLIIKFKRKFLNYLLRGLE